MKECRNRLGKGLKNSSQRKLSSLLCIALLSTLSAMAVPPPGGVAPVLIPVGGFRIDGDLMADPFAGDWLGGTNASSGVLSAAGVPLNPNTTFHFADPYNTTADDIFAGGLKWTDNPNIWTWVNSKASSKTDINNGLMHVATDADGHTWTIIAADRASTSGDSYIDFEFLQNTLIKTNGGKFISSGPNGGRTTNDLLLSLAFVGGGSTADFLAYRWLPDGSGGYAYVDVTASLPVGRVFVALNSNTIAVPFGAFGATTYTPNAFVEAALDMTALLGGFDPCLSLGFKTIMVKTKSSASSTASISDFINPIQYSLRIGPSANAGPDQMRCTEGDSTAFPLAGQAIRGMQPIASNTWSVIAGSATIDDASSLVTTARVSSASATLRLTVVQANGCTETDDVVLTVASYPTCSITGASLLCPGSTNTFQAPAGMTGYAWSISGNGTISGATNAQTVKVISGAACGATFTLDLVATSGICSSACTTDVLVADTTPPTMIIPPDRILDCPAVTTTNVTGSATAQDDCGKVTVTYSDAVTPTCGGAKVIARTWIATDSCGNSTNAVQTITVRDITPPTLVLPVNLTLECPANTNTSNTGVATSQDGCGSVTVSFTDVVSNSCGGARLISRIWTAIDSCGNSTNGTQLITVRDTTRPTLVLPANLTLECPADTSTNNTGMATSQDGCGAVTITFSDSVSNTCGGASVIRRLWTAADGCGNSTNGTQTITVRDTTRPSLVLPPNLTLECPANTSTNNTGVAVAQDACSSVAVTFSDVVTTNCGGTRVVARTWTAADACGNTTNAVQTITVRDSTPPNLIIPANLTLECPANITTNNTGVATATDGCGTVVISFSDITTTNCGGTRSIARTWAARDQCGNTTNAVQTITVRDTTPPIITAPADLVLDCPAVTTTNATGVATASDGCGSVSIRYSDSVSNSCGGASVISRIWTATDQCGNSSSATQKITLRDITPPKLTLPANLTLDCPANTNTSNTGVATAQDTCSSVTVSFTDSVSNNCGGATIIKRLWTATDACGNSTNGIQTITVRDVTAPSLSIPANLTLECPADTRTNNTGVAVAQDSCSAVTVTYSDIVSNNCGGSKVIQRTWTASDACGNTTNRVQTITVVDTTRPSLSLPPNLTLECPANTSTNNTGVAIATDGCSSIVLTFSDVVTTNCGGTRVVARTWTATDACGNTTNAVQTITVRDSTPPSLVIPANLTLECPANTSTTNTGVATATDGCGTVVISFSDVVTTNCGGTRVVSRTWSARDQCGNTTNAVQTITVRDTTPPIITAPADLVLDCPAVTTTNATGVATASDGCGSVSISYSDSVSNSCGNAKVISRTWTATDQCGNNSSAVQKITVRDITPPTITAPANLTIECGSSTATNATGFPTASDGCSAVSISYTDTITNNCGGTRIISRLWSAADQCGNSATALQIITVIDTTPPSLRLPANITLQCPGDTRTNITGVPIASDACGSVAITYSDIVSNSCGFTKTVWRTWVAMDQCGNTTNGVQTITVVDTTKPTITCPNISVQCVGDIPPAYTNMAAFLAAGGTAYDNCSSTLQFAFISDSGLTGRCPGTVTRVYRVTDDCGNFADLSHRITVDDTIPPVLTCPTNRTVELGLSLDPTNTGLATATDNCATNVAISYSDSQLDSSYSVNFYAADPDPGTGPYSPTYVKLGPAGLPCPTSAMLAGRATDPLRNAVAFSTNGQLDALTSLGGAPMTMGQIVPFEAVIQMSGAPGPERGTIEFSASWATYTTSNQRFGFDTNYMVYCAFVDDGDPGCIDPNKNARVQSVSSTIINQGTPTEQIVGTFRVTGLDPGDQVVVEIWMVLDSSQPGNVGGTIAAQLVSAAKYLNPPQPISIGSKTISIGNLNKMNPLPPPQQQPPPIPPTPQQTVPPGTTISIINRTWTATDDCGNQSTCVQQFAVRDTTPPLVNVTNLILDCPADTSTNATGIPTVSDAGGGPITFYCSSETVSNYCGGTKVVSRVWTATDMSGNTTNVLQTITVRDITPPSLAVPADVTLECPSVNTGTNFTGSATAQDGCGSVLLSFSDLVTTNCGGTRLIARTWTATDSCGNTTNAVQSITIRDSTPPSLTLPPDVTVQCAAGTDTNTTGVASATDGCGSVTISFTDTFITNSGSYVISRTWTAADSCGNTTNAVQSITVRDTTPPTIKAMLVNTVSQTNQTPQLVQTNFLSLFPNGIAIGLFNASNGFVAPNGLLWEPNSNGLTAVQAVLSIVPGAAGAAFAQDATNPVTVMAGGNLARQALLLTLNIGLNTAGMLGAGPNNFGSLVYTNTGDALNGQSISQILVAANQALAGLALPAGYNFTSLAALLGNLNTAFQSYAPSAWATAHLSAPMLVVQCSGQVPAADPAFITASDSCGGAVTITNLDTTTSYTNPCNFILRRTWIARDLAGNTNACSYQIIVRDTIPPVLTIVPALKSVQPNTNWSFGTPDATDNCGVASVNVLSTTTNITATNTMLICRTWVATDIAGNTNTCSQTVSIFIGPPPTITSQPSGQTFGYDDSGKLTVVASGTGPFTYQWFFNGVEIPGATGNRLNLSGLQYTNAGLYTVVVTGPGGSVTSSVAVVNVLPRLIGQQASGKRLMLSWTGQFILQSADNFTGPFTDLPGAINPTLVKMNAPQKFFRLRSQSATLGLKVVSGKPVIDIAGSPGENFILQASTNLVNWTSLQTNTLPMTFTDTDVSQHPTRFYRAMMAR
jgi:hypothetical protein